MCQIEGNADDIPITKGLDGSDVTAIKLYRSIIIEPNAVSVGTKKKPSTPP